MKINASWQQQQQHHKYYYYFLMTLLKQCLVKHDSVDAVLRTKKIIIEWPTMMSLNQRSRRTKDCKPPKRKIITETQHPTLKLKTFIHSFFENRTLMMMLMLFLWMPPISIELRPSFCRGMDACIRNYRSLAQSLRNQRTKKDGWEKIAQTTQEPQSQTKQE